VVSCGPERRCNILLHFYKCGLSSENAPDDPRSGARRREPARSPDCHVAARRL